MGDREMVECPFDPLHRMLRNRLQQHLLRCRLNHPDSNLKPCPFNSTHLIAEDDLKTHVLRCPDRKIITNYQTAVQVKDEDLPVKQTRIECSENWDECDDFNPLVNAVRPNVIRMPKSYQHAERKAFVKQERERFGELPRTPSPPRLSTYDSGDDDSKIGEMQVEEAQQIPLERIQVKSERFGGRPRTPSPPRLSTFDSDDDDSQAGEFKVKVEPMVEDAQQIPLERHRVKSERDSQYYRTDAVHQKREDRRNDRRDGRKDTRRYDRSEYTPYSKYPNHRGDRSNRDIEKSNRNYYSDRRQNGPSTSRHVPKLEADDEEFERAYSSLPMYGKRK